MLSVAIAASVALATCPPVRVMRELSGSNLYIGEVHGSEEGPAIVLCLVRYAMRHTRQPLLVSLELPSAAVNEESPFWSGSDGRSSEAMFKLVKSLRSLMAEDRIKLHFQYGTDLVSMSRGFDKRIGLKLAKMTRTSHVIAYGGNFHSLKVLLAGMGSELPAGMYMTRKTKHVMIGSTMAGTSWYCDADNSCGQHGVAPVVKNERSDYRLVNGAKYGHDFLLLIPRITPSRPRRLVTGDE